MQYQITCNHCHQLYVVDAAPGATLRSRCPYCGQVATVATPCAASPAGQPRSTASSQPQRTASKPAASPALQPSSSALTRWVVRLFCIAALLLIIIATILYVAFSGMTS